MASHRRSSGGLLAVILAVSGIAAAAASSQPADYIIVGGGTAGFVLAERLSRNPHKQVVLLEAGPDGINSDLQNTPAYYILNQEYFWNFTSKPDPNLGGSSPEIRQGRLFGGGSGVNGMAYCRGASSVFDEWAKLSGNPGLAWDSLLSDFKEVSHYTFQPANYDQLVNTTVYGPQDRGVEVSRTSGLTGFEKPFFKALQTKFGLKEVDMTDGAGIGLVKGLAAIKVDGRRRSYARTTFGELIEHRSNVKMLSNAWVSKIGFTGHTASSVTYLDTQNNQNVTLSAKEIIVSSGAINTPKLLKLSGVGPRNELKKLGLPVISDNPAVGVALRDHLFPVVEVLVTKDIYTVWQWSQNTTEAAIAKQQYAKDGSGPLGWDNGLVFGALRVPDSVFAGIDGSHYKSLPADRPHLLMEFSTVPFLRSTPNASAVTAWVSLVQPEAAGTVTLASANFRDDPVVFSNYYGSPADKAAVLWGYKKLREVMASKALQPVIKSEFWPGPNVTSDVDLWRAIQQQSFSFHHPLGSVALGTALDANWRLKGLRGIRVVDISTFPSPTTCHPMAAVYALANRAAKDIVKADG